MTSPAGQRSQPESAASAGMAVATSQRASLTVTERLIDVGDSRLQIESAGTGTPPVIVDTGHGALALSWRGFRDLMCSERAVYLYDRPGYGQSTQTTGSSDAAAAADRLARLLTAADVTEPVILVGHSVGALRAICFASRHPGRVAGLVLVDPSVPSPSARMQIRMLLEYARRTAGAVVRSLAMAWARARKQENPPDSNIAGRFVAGDRGQAAGYLPSGNLRRGRKAEKRAMLTSRRQASAAGIAPGLPLVVITRAAPAAQRHRVERALDIISWRETWQAHEHLARSSSCAVHLTASHAGHSVHRDEPEIIAAAIRHLASEAAHLQPPMPDRGPDGA